MVGNSYRKPSGLPSTRTGNKACMFTNIGQIQAEKRAKNPTSKETRSGNPFTHGLDYLAKQLVESNDLDPYAWKNIQLMLELRDSSIHFYSKSQVFRNHLQKIGAACVKNFANALHDWFDRRLSEFELPIMPLAFSDIPSEMDIVLLNVAEKKFLTFLEEHNKLESGTAPKRGCHYGKLPFAGRCFRSSFHADAFLVCAGHIYASPTLTSMRTKGGHAGPPLHVVRYNPAPLR